jgi:hypothetical protein
MIYSKYEALQLVIETLHPTFYLDFKFRSEKEFDQRCDYEDTIPFKLQISQLGTTLSSWAAKMHLVERRNPLVLCIIKDKSDDDDSLETPAIYALSNDLNYNLCGRSGHEDTSFHKFMNHVIIDAHYESAPKRKGKYFARAQAINDNRTPRRPPS